MYTLIYKEVMLNNIRFRVNNTIEFEFYNADNGDNIDSIVCQGIYLFKYSSSLLLDEESMPYFVLDVSDEITDAEGVISKLTDNKYSYYQQDGSPVVKSDDFVHVFKIQGGGIDIIVISQKLHWN